jgi:hypothetical protein
MSIFDQSVCNQNIENYVSDNKQILLSNKINLKKVTPNEIHTKLLEVKTQIYICIFLNFYIRKHFTMLK